MIAEDAKPLRDCREQEQADTGEAGDPVKHVAGVETASIGRQMQAAMFGVGLGQECGGRKTLRVGKLLAGGYAGAHRVETT